MTQNPPYSPDQGGTPTAFGAPAQSAGQDPSVPQQNTSGPVSPDGSGYPTTLAPAMEPPQGSKKKAVAGGVAAVIGVGAIAGGAWAFSAFGGGGDQAADHLPANALMVAQVDLNPDIFAKKDAKDFLDKFDKVKSGLSGANNDPRQWLWDESTKNSKSAPSWSEVDAWLGDRGGVAVVPDDTNKPTVVWVIKVKDVAKAKETLAKSMATSSTQQSSVDMDGTDDSLSSNTGDKVGVADQDNWLYIAGNKDQDKANALAQRVKDDAQKNSLSRLSKYRQDMDTVGDSLLSMWVDLDATRSYTQEALSGAPMFANAYTPFLGKDLFGGHAAVGLKFSGGNALELVSAGHDMPQMNYFGANSTPADVNVSDDAVGFMSVSKGGEYLTKNWSQIVKNYDDSRNVAVSKSSSSSLSGVDDSLHGASASNSQPRSLQDTAEEVTGVKFPDEMARLLGEQFSGTVYYDGTQATGGFRVKSANDPSPVLNKLLSNGVASGVVRQDIAGGYVLASDNAAADKLAQGGKLSDSKAFKEAVPDAGKASMIAFVNVASLYDVMKSERSPNSSASDSVDPWIAPLQSIGMAAWADGDGSKSIIRITTR